MRLFGRTGLACAFLASHALAGTPSAAIFDEGHAPPTVVAQAVGQLGIRQRLAKIDLEQLGGIRRRVREGHPAQVRLNLWPDAQFATVFERASRTSAGYSLSGRLAGKPHGATTLVINGETVVGTVWTPSALYDIRTVNGVQLLREVDVASLPRLAAPVVWGWASRRGWGRQSQLSDAGARAGAEDDGSVVDLLVLWTAAAAKHAGGTENVKALIDLGVAAANDAYARSGVNFRLSLAGSEQTGFPDWDDSFAQPFGLSIEEQEAWEAALGAKWEEVFSVRDRVGADITTIVMEMPFGGYANLMHELSPEFEELAYNFVSVERVAYNTLAHEIGHNMGLQHDRHVNPLGGAFPYSHGYVNQRAFDPGAPLDSCWVTIMAYLDQCGLGGHRLAVRIPYFSNPDQRYPTVGGDPLGVGENSEFTDARGPANAVASLNKARRVVANFRPSLGDRGGATDHGDTARGATAVLVQSATRGLLEAADVDFFRIDVPRTGVLRVETTGTTDTQGTLTSASGDTDSPGTQDDDSGQDANFRIEQRVKGGSYLVAVRGADGAQGPYRLHASLDWLGDDDHGDSAQAATRVAMPSATDGVLGVDDVDCFRIDLEEAALVRVEPPAAWTPTASSRGWTGGPCWRTTMAAATRTSASKPLSLPARISWKCAASPLGQLEVSHSNPATGFYTLNVWTGPNGRNDDHGDTLVTATRVAMPSATTAALETALDVDFFRIDLPALGTVRVQTSGTTDTHGRLLHAGGRYSSDLSSNDDGGAGENFLLEETLGSDTYFVEVRGFRGATTGAYDLHVSFVPGEDDHGNTTEDATAIALPSSNTGRIDARFDVDYFRATLPEVGTLAVTIESDYAQGALLQKGRVVAAPNADGRIRAAKLPPGDYFVVMRAGSRSLLPQGVVDQTYTLDARFTPAVADDHGDIEATATAVAMPSTTAGELEQGGDADFFRVDLPRGILRARTTGLTNTRGSVSCCHDEWGWRLLADEDSGEDGNFAIETAVAGGRYFVHVRGADEETTGRYVLELSFEAETPQPDDHGNAQDAASVVGLGSTTSGELHDGSDADMFRIDVPVEGVLRVETTGETDTVGSLAAEDGAWMAEDDNGGDALNFRLERWVPAGTYFVTVRGWRDATGPYALKVSLTSTEQLTGHHTVPLLLSARQTPARQGLLRLVNHSPTASTVKVHAFDDAGDVRGPILLGLGAGHALQIESHDLDGQRRQGHLARRWAGRRRLASATRHRLGHRTAGLCVHARRLSHRHARHRGGKRLAPPCAVVQSRQQPHAGEPAAADQRQHPRRGSDHCGR